MLAFASNCSVRDADAQIDVSAPVLVKRDQANDPRPELTEEALSSERVYEDWVSDRFDWGDRRNLLAYRWCMSWNSIVVESARVDCGKPPEGVDDH